MYLCMRTCTCMYIQGCMCACAFVYMGAMWVQNTGRREDLFSSAPVLMYVAPPPWRPPIRRRRQASHAIVPEAVQFERCSPPLVMWGT